MHSTHGSRAVSRSWRGRPPQAIEDRLAEAVGGQRHDRDRRRARRIQGAERPEQTGGGLADVAGRTEVEDRPRRVRARRSGAREGEEGFARRDPVGVEPHAGLRRVVRGQQTRGQRACLARFRRDLHVVARNGVEKSKPEHWAQMQLYMHWSGMERAYYLAVNKDTDDLYGERVHYDKEAATRLVAKAQAVVTALV